MDHERTTRPVEYWQDLEGTVTAKVRVAIRGGQDGRQRVIAYLRDLEEIARTQCDRRETIQVIASGRRLLGDRSSVGPADGPFAHTLGAEL